MHAVAIAAGFALAAMLASPALAQDRAPAAVPDTSERAPTAAALLRVPLVVPTGANWNRSSVQKDVPIEIAITTASDPHGALAPGAA